MVTVRNIRSWAYHADSRHSPPEQTDGIRLHLGCGKKYLPGWINVDNAGPKLDLEADITALPYPDNFADQIMAIHVWEHIWLCQAEAVLAHWFAKLKPGGKLILEMPDLVKFIKYAYEDVQRLEAGEAQATEYWLANPKHHPFKTIFAFYGDAPDPKRPEDLHKWGWTFRTLAPVFEKVGFVDVVEKRAAYHFPDRDFRIEGSKPCV